MLGLALWLGARGRAGGRAGGRARAGANGTYSLIFCPTVSMLS